MDRDHLRSEHALDLVARSDPVHRSKRAVHVPLLEGLRWRASATGFQQFVHGPVMEVGRNRPECREQGKDGGFGLPLGGHGVDGIGRPMIYLEPWRPMSNNLSTNPL